MQYFSFWDWLISFIIMSSRFIHVTYCRIHLLDGYYKTKTTAVSEDEEKLEPLHTGDGNVKWCCYYGKQYKVSAKS